jgi:hypothetical protein
MLLTERNIDTGWEELSARTRSGWNSKSHSGKPTAAKAECPTGQSATIASKKVRGREVAGHGNYFIPSPQRFAKLSNDTGILTTETASCWGRSLTLGGAKAR